jgi:hypothetical protein
LKAEFGDAVAYGKITAVFAQQEGLLIGWDVNDKTVSTLDQMTSGSGELALYRSQNANQSGGPSKNDGIFAFGEGTDPNADEIFGANFYARIMGDPEHTSLSITLPKGWYIGNNVYVDVSSHFAGFEVGLSDFFISGGVTIYTARKFVQEAGKLSGKVASESPDERAGIATLTVDVASSTTLDTSYTIMPGLGRMPIYPVPTLRIQ